MTNLHLKIEDIWHHYQCSSGNDWAIKMIKLNLNHGELVGLLGPSGSGKTTLLRLIAGFERPARGSIYINGKEVSSSKILVPPEHRHVGMVFQDYALFPHLDAWQNTCFGLKRRENKNRAAWLLDLLGLTPFRNRYPHELSGGQKQRLALARALAPGTSLVLLDEPFSSLDAEVRVRLRSELSGVLKTCGASGIMVTHDPQEALAICDRVAVLRDGTLDQCATPREIVNTPATPFVGRFVLQRNILPVSTNGGSWITPLGPLSSPRTSDQENFTELMVDEQAIQISSDPSGAALIQSLEFLGNQWLLRIELGNLLLHVRQPLDISFKAGDRCYLNFMNGKNGILFPGGIRCTL